MPGDPCSLGHRPAVGVWSQRDQPDSRPMGACGSPFSSPAPGASRYSLTLGWNTCPAEPPCCPRQSLRPLTSRVFLLLCQHPCSASHPSRGEEVPCCPQAGHPPCSPYFHAVRQVVLGVGPCIPQPWPPGTSSGGPAGRACLQSWRFLSPPACCQPRQGWVAPTSAAAWVLGSAGSPPGLTICLLGFLSLVSGGSWLPVCLSRQLLSHWWAAVGPAVHLNSPRKGAGVVSVGWG